MLHILFAISVGVLCFLCAYGIIRHYLKLESQVRARVKSLGESALPEDSVQAAPRQDVRPWHFSLDMQDVTFAERVLRPAYVAFTGVFSRFAPAEVLALVDRRLTLAGIRQKFAPGKFLLFSLLCAAAGWGAAYLLFVADRAMTAGFMRFVQGTMTLVAGGILGGLFPTLILQSMINRRQEQILRQLPQVLDLLSVSVHAGLSFDGSLRKITDRMQGPFIDECRRLQDDIRMGMVRRTAFRHVAERCGLQDVSLFVTSIIQAERLGTSMSKTLQSQSDNLRERHRQEVKAMALKAPVKMLFPLVFCIFPALFVVVLLPSILVLIRRF